MMKRKEFIGLGLALMILISSSSVLAKSSSPYGPEGRRLGAGIYVGDPTGLTVKGYLTPKLSIDGIAAWGFVDEAFTVIGDVTYDFFDIPVDSRTVTLPFYAGAGAKFEFDAGPNDETVVGIRVPVGVGIQWIDYPVEVFVEIVPGIDVAPSSEFDLMGGIGVRYYF